MSLSGQLDYGTILAVNSLGINFYGPIMSIANLLMLVITTLPVLKKYDVPNDDKIVLESVVDVNINQSEIVLNNLAFKYINNDKLVINNLNYNFEFGKKYLIIGASGSGKSTLLKIIGGLFSNYLGSVYVCGKDRRIYTNRDLKISYTDQKPYLFSKSLAFNIALNENYDHDKLDYAIKKAKLIDFVVNLPEGINTIIDEERFQVSGGENTRINLARAFYLDLDIMLFDEITASLDKELSNEIDETILLQSNKLIINIAHKYNEKHFTVYDKVLQFTEQGLEELYHQ